ncbi:MAG TPA: phospholipid carrier-dependent glycosyltransferase [Planctomycetes bacterium]|nr:phospholipid carrier-dependent glycosyltransferase [Planctomycetota bacterium]
MWRSRASRRDGNAPIEETLQPPPPPPPESSTGGAAVRLPRLAALLVLLLALGLRVASIQSGLDFTEPHHAVFNVNLDERGMVFEELELMEGDWHPGLFVMRGTAPFYLDGAADALTLRALSMIRGEGWDETVARARENPSVLFLVHRLLAALASFGTVWILMRTIAREFGPRAGLLSGLLLACAYLPVHLSHLGVIDLGWVFFATLALDRLLRYLRDARPRDLVLAGIWIGASASFKYPGGLLAVQVLAAFLVARSAAARDGSAAPKLSHLAASGAACLVTFLALNPHLVLWPDAFRDALRLQSETLHMESEGAIHWRALLAHLRVSVPLGIGEPVAALAALGLVLALLRGGRARALALFALLTIPTAMIANIPSPRFAIAVATAAIPLAALALDRLFARAGTRFAPAIVGIVLAPSLARDLSFDWILTRRDTRSEMMERIEALGVPAREVVAVGHRGLPDPLPPPAPFLNLFAQIRRGKMGPEDVIAHPPTYLLRDLNAGRSDRIAWEPFRELVEERYEEVLHLDGRDPRGAPERKAGYYISPRLFLPFHAPWLRRRPGPGLVLYRLRSTTNPR